MKSKELVVTIQAMALSLAGIPLHLYNQVQGFLLASKTVGTEKLGRADNCGAGGGESCTSTRDKKSKRA